MTGKALLGKAKRRRELFDPQSKTALVKTKRGKALGSLTPEKKTRFLDLLASTGISLAGAAEAVGVSYYTIYAERDRDPEFAEAIRVAREGGSDHMEDALLKIGVRNNNPTALIFLLNGRRPDVYRQRTQTDLTNSDGSLMGLFAEAMFISVENSRPAHAHSGNGHVIDASGDQAPQ